MHLFYASRAVMVPSHLSLDMCSEICKAALLLGAQPNDLALCFSRYISTKCPLRKLHCFCHPSQLIQSSLGCFCRALHVPSCPELYIWACYMRDLLCCGSNGNLGNLRTKVALNICKRPFLEFKITPNLGREKLY